MDPSTGTGAAGLSASSRVELDRLSEISKRLAELNEKLSLELSGSKKSSDELALLLESSRTELAKLKLELEASRRISSELVLRTERSWTESLELRTELTKAENSLRSLEESFADYRKATETSFRRLERSNFLTRLWGLIASILAVSGWASFLVAFFI